MAAESLESIKILKSIIITQYENLTGLDERFEEGNNILTRV